ncbi:MAG: flagellar hook-associated protein FlgK, partial [Desulfatirhabdiaceae bacterium]
LIAHQLALNVTGHNIANVNTPGYTRQRVNLVTNSTQATPVGTLGTGVNVTKIQRLVDRFTGTRINQNIQDQGRFQATHQALEQVETVFTETEDYGLSHSMNAFWNAWQDVAANTTGYPERLALTSAGTVMVDNFNQSRASLSAIQNDLDTAIQDGVSQINDIADKLNSLNKIITDLTNQGQAPNDLLDQRDSLLNNLSELIDFTASETDGKLTVTLGDGKILVGDSPNGRLTTSLNASGFQDIVWMADTTTSINNDIGSGKLKGWMDVRDGRIPEYAQRLDDLAKEMIAAVNGLHTTGFALDGTTTGKDFFTGASAIDIQVNPELIQNPNLVAAAAAGNAADNTQAIAIAALQNTDRAALGTARFDEYHAATLSLVGNDVNAASSSLAFQTDVGTQLENYRESISGVSLDEEMVSLIKYQHGYGAAARVITTVDEMITELLNMV